MTSATTPRMKNFELIEVHQPDVSCDGSGGALGHPRVYLHIDAQAGRIVCPYCSKTYVLKAGKTKAH